jgi:hypothetical protein
MTDPTDRPVPDEPPPDDYQWTGEPGDPDAGGAPAEFVDDPEAANQDFDQESKN